MPEGCRSLTKLFLDLFKPNKVSENTTLPLESSWHQYEDIKAEDIMIPRSDIKAVDHSSNLADIGKRFLDTRHTRMPVFKEDLDNIIGFINIKDILPYLLHSQNYSDFNIDKVIRKLLIISPSMKILNLLEKMRESRTHIALVIDEFGGSDGLITIEDLVEKIIGKIDDEHDNFKLEIIEIDNNTFEANGRIAIELLEEKLGVKFAGEDEDEYDTLGGLILSISGHVPVRGEKIFHSKTGVVFEILESDPRRIKRVLIKKE